MTTQAPEIVKLGYTKKDDDKIPATVTEATMVEGKGTFEIAFNAAVVEETPSLVFTTRTGDLAGVFPYNDDLDVWLQDILDHERYHSFINYEVIPREDWFTVEYPILGRDIGYHFDHHETKELHTDWLDQLSEVLEALRDGTRNE